MDYSKEEIKAFEAGYQKYRAERNLERWNAATKFRSTCDQHEGGACELVVYISENAMACFPCAIEATWDLQYLTKVPRPGTEGRYTPVKC
jgi:hypothetical protein